MILLFASAGVLTGVLVSNSLFRAEIGFSSNLVFEILVPSLLITIVFILFFAAMKKGKIRQASLEEDLLRAKRDISSNETGSIAIKDDDMILNINYRDIVYISSRGRSSAVHTSGRDYTLNRLLGDLAETLPSGVFLRIHKQFIVNRRFIKGVRYNEGGRYNMYLTDEDENILPIGKAYTSEVRKIMNF
jgi:DNA-binding LytR/AlgR family response regulator